MGKPVSVSFIAQQLLALNRAAKSPIWEYQIRGSVGENKEEESFLEANYKFRNFATTWKFLNRVAGMANKERHHPTIETTYNRVNIKITTHDAGNKVTYNDLKLADGIQTEYYNNFIVPKKLSSFRDFVADAKSELKLHEPNQIISELMEKEQKHEQNDETEKKEQ